MLTNDSPFGAARIYRVYKAWCEGRREEPLSSTAFGNQLTQHFGKDHTNKGTVYRGVTVKEDSSEENHDNE
jgi:phage/plasmid-associated DNA primase